MDVTIFQDNEKLRMQQDYNGQSYKLKDAMTKTVTHSLNLAAIPTNHIP